MNTKIPMSRRDAEILRLFSSGLPCSKIDRLLKLFEGTSHDVMVMLWALDKEMAVRNKRTKIEKDLMGND